MNGRQTLSEAMRASVEERLREARASLLDDQGIDVLPPKSEVSVAEAITILSQRKHRDWSDWKQWSENKAYVCGAQGSIVYSTFDAVAIAEKYERDA